MNAIMRFKTFPVDGVRLFEEAQYGISFVLPFVKQSYYFKFKSERFLRKRYKILAGYKSAGQKEFQKLSKARIALEDEMFDVANYFVKKMNGGSGE